jgi:hypothetical protein
MPAVKTLDIDELQFLMDTLQCLNDTRGYTYICDYSSCFYILLF